MKFYINFFLCGALTAFLFPPFFLIPIGFIVFPYLFFLLTNKCFTFSYFKHFSFGFIFGLGFFSIYLMWIKEPFLLIQEAKKFSFLSYFLIIYCSLYFGGVFCIIKFFKNKITKLIMIPSIIVIAEFVCSNLSYGFPWFSFSIINSANIIGTSLIFYIGTYGLSYITILIFLFPIVFLLKKSKSKKILLIMYFLISLLILLSIMLRLEISKENDIKKINLSIIQMNYKSNEILKYDELIKKEKKIIEIINASSSEIIIFAENDYPFLMSADKIKYIQNSILKDKIVIIGATTKKNNQFYNSFFVIDKIDHQYFDKKILVPFGEFIPLRNVIGFMDFIAGSIDFSQGLNERILILENRIKIIPVICYEIIYFWKLVNKKNYESDFIINITNDSWFGSFSGPYQHFYFSKLRAAEFNKPIIRVSNNGISGYINNYGKIINFIDLNISEMKEINLLTSNNHYNNLFYHNIYLIFIFILIFFGIISNKKNEY